MPKSISQKQEAAVAKQLATVYTGENAVHVQPGSGNKAHAPNDVLVKGSAYVECKATMAKQMTLHLAWLERARKLAQLSGLRAYVAVEFTLFSSSQYYVVEDVDFLHLLQCERELNDSRK